LALNASYLSWISALVDTAWAASIIGILSGYCTWRRS
jgi:hypothetical protein